MAVLTVHKFTDNDNRDTETKIGFVQTRGGDRQTQNDAKKLSKQHERQYATQQNGQSHAVDFQRSTLAKDIVKNRERRRKTLATNGIRYPNRMRNQVRLCTRTIGVVLK